jgi:hypothetical protein
MKLEAISLIRFLPAGAADVGVSREALRAADAGAWSAPGGQRDDVRCLAGDGRPPSAQCELADYDPVVPLDDRAVAQGERAIPLRFGTSG